MLETTLRTLFDYQRFDQNTALQSVIDEVLDRYAQKELFILSDDQVALAAGGVSRGMPDETREPQP